MKKLILTMATALCLASGLSAQETLTDTSGDSDTRRELDSLSNELASMKAREAQREADEKLRGIWKRSKFFNIAFVNSTLEAPDAGSEWNSKSGLSMMLGNTYFLHRRPLGGIVKIGLDAKWFDITYVKYKTDPKESGSASGALSNYIDDDDLDLNIGMHQLDLGLGLGPSVHVAPFTSFSNGLEHLRASLYFHFTPSYSLILTDEDGDVNVNHGFVPFINFGGTIAYKLISIGIEGRWGSAKYKMAGFDDEDDEVYDPSTGSIAIPGFGTQDKQKFKTKSLRVFLSLRF